jgi:hypothetical protein
MDPIPVVGSEADLPAEVAGLHLQGVRHHTDPDSGVQIRYGITAFATADVYLYTQGFSDISDDLWSAEVEARFEDSCTLIKMTAAQGLYTDLVTLQSGYLFIPADAPEPLCLWASFAYTVTPGTPIPMIGSAGGTPVMTDMGRKSSHVGLRTDHGYLNKVRYTHPAEDGEKGFAGFRAFVAAWTDFVKRRPRVPQPGTHRPGADSPSAPDSPERGFLEQVQQFARDMGVAAAARPGEVTDSFLVTGGPYGVRVVLQPLLHTQDTPTTMGYFVASGVGCVRATDAALVFHIPQQVGDPVSGGPGPDHDHDRRASVGLLHATRDGTCAFYTADVHWRDGSPAEVGPWTLHQARPDEQWLLGRLPNGAIVTRNVDISRYAEWARYGMELADDINFLGDSTMRDKLDAAFHAGPAAFAQTAAGYRELFLRELLLKAFSGGDFIDFIGRLPYGLAPEVFDAAVAEYLRERGAIP